MPPLDAAQEWLRLQRLYLEMGDVELERLRDEFDELTPTAQSVLEPILRERKLWDVAPVETERETADPEIDIDSQLADHGVAARSYESHEDAYLWAELLKEAGIPSLALREKRGVPVRIPDLIVLPQDFDRALTLLDSTDIETLRRQYEDSIAGTEVNASDACPRCGSEEILIQPDRPDCLNAWQCAACRHQWVDPLPADWPAPDHSRRD